ncbi:restriction endonuclease [Candidatus Neomarinimicrobiota bacterium]
MEHEFTPKIFEILAGRFGDMARDIYNVSPLLQYINLKTVSASRGSKARSSYGNIYALYVLIEDYINGGFATEGDYSEYKGARFADLFQRQRELPFGSKLQNHALNHRLNQEFIKFFPNSDVIPIIRVVETQRYWINEELLNISIGNKQYNIAEAIIDIIDEYIRSKQSAFQKFIDTCEQLRRIEGTDFDTSIEFILSLIAPNVDARIFEIVSFAILRSYYHDKRVFIGFELEEIEEEPLILYKTGRTNANDGGIDFVMRPLGRFFQVTETLDVKKYFLDIDKIERYPISFVIKSDETVEQLTGKLEIGAKRLYSVRAIVDKYMSCIEEVINIPILRKRLLDAVEKGYLNQILDEIVRQSKVEFNIIDEPTASS